MLIGRRGAPLRRILALMLSLSSLAAAVAGYRSIYAQAAVKLSLPATSSTTAAAVVDVPVSLDTAGQQVSGVLFSVDYDQHCLRFHNADADADGLPDGFQALIPADFSVSAAVDATDDDGEIDAIVLDLSLPFSSLPPGPIAVLRFTATCVPEYASIVRSPIEFSTSPSASFSSPLGRNIHGFTVGGIVEIVDSAAPPTATPTRTPTTVASSTPTASLTPTPTLIEITGTPMQEVTPTATPTPSGGQVKPPLPPSATPTATPTIPPPPTATSLAPEEAPSGQSAENLFLPAIHAP